MSINELSGQHRYERSNGAKSLLMSMCIGLSSSDTEERVLGDVTVEPFLSSKQKRQFIPKKSELVKEVERRFDLKLDDGEKKPRAGNWSNTTLIEWLMSHPLVEEQEVTYLQKEEKKFYDMLVAAAREATDVSGNSLGSPPGLIWTNVADMRLIHCLTVDSVKEAYLQRNEVLNRRQLDARNGPSTTPSVEQVVSNQYNDPSYKPQSIPLPSSHDAFITSIDLSLEEVPCKVTPDQVKRWLADRKTKLVLVINKWERSGNGGGNRKEADEMFGQEEGAEFQDDDDRANFLSGNRTSLLYFWHMAIEHDLLSHTVNILPTELSATTNSVSPVSRKSRKGRKRKNDNESSIPNDIVEGFKAISRATRSEEIANCDARIERDERRVEEYIKKLDSCNDDDNLRQFYQERLESAKKMLIKATEEYDKLHKE